MVIRCRGFAVEFCAYRSPIPFRGHRPIVERRESSWRLLTLRCRAGSSHAEPDRQHQAAMNSNDINPDTRFATHMMPYAYDSLNMPRHRHDSLVRHRSNVEIAGRKAAPKDLARGGSDHPTERPGEVCRIRETGSRRCIRHRRAARELTGTTLQTQPEYVRS